MPHRRPRDPAVEPQPPGPGDDVERAASDVVSADGSPLAVYLALPPGEAPLLVHGAIAPVSSILELGSGPGRVTRVLVALGHRVTAVDDSDEMLAHVTGATTVRADVLALDLDERFDVVVAASHLANLADPDRRAALFRVCRRHVDDRGLVIVERYPPGWLLDAGPSMADNGPVRIRYRPGALRGSVRSATVTYELGGRSWTQAFDAADVDDAQLSAEAGAAGLEVASALDDRGRWLTLRPRAARP